MVFRVLIPTKKLTEVIEWAKGKYEFLHRPFYDDYFNEEMNATQLLFNQELVAQVVALKFGDGSYREF